MKPDTQVVDLRAEVAWLAALCVIATALLYRFPAVDLGVASWFHDPEDGFPWARDPVVRTVRDLFIWPLYLLGIAILAAIVWRRARGSYLFGLTRRSICFLVLFAAIGPGLIVNHGFKDHWGRARPHQITQFGGDSAFSPPLEIADQCGANCSFFSGEASYGFAFAALAFLVAPAWRRRVFWATVGFGSVIGLVRIMMGAHFLSDIVFSALFVVPLAWWMHREIVVRGRLDPLIDRIAGQAR